jgi:hypothetical protein
MNNAYCFLYTTIWLSPKCRKAESADIVEVDGNLRLLKDHFLSTGNWDTILVIRCLLLRIYGPQH